MSDVALSIVNSSPVNLALASSTVALDSVAGTAVALNIANQTAVSLDIVNQSPVVFTFSCFDFVAWASTVNEYDSNEAAITAGESYYKASASHEGAYKGTFIIL